MQSYIEIDEEDLYTLKINFKGKSRKGKQKNKCRKNIIGLKRLKIKIKKKRKTPRICKNPT